MLNEQYFLPRATSLSRVDRPQTSSRRDFMRRALATSMAFGGLFALGHRQARGHSIESEHLGALVERRSGLLDLPRGFEVFELSNQHDPMDDGLLVPSRPDGMGAFTDSFGRVVLMRNHELSDDLKLPGPFGLMPEARRLARCDVSRFYSKPSSVDVLRLNQGNAAPMGCVTTMVLDPESLEVKRQFLSMAGMMRNCAGGVTPWGSWLTCEEDTTPKGNGSRVDHGYVFEVRARSRQRLQRARPIRAMGRFRHEAAGVHAESGCVYMTEDMKDGLFYRFVPKHQGQLARGGTLYALALRNHPKSHTTSELDPQLPHAVRWVELDDVTSPLNDLRWRGRVKGAIPFVRGEGVWVGADGIYFAASEGGTLGRGQVWKYEPSPQEGTALESKHPGLLRQIYECKDPTSLAHCDNLTVAPWGDLLLCEDRGRSKPKKGDPLSMKRNMIWGLTPRGKIYPFARNRVGNGRCEFAGACFSPDGKTMFVNIHQSGITLAIRGPWPHSR